MKSFQLFIPFTNNLDTFYKALNSVKEIHQYTTVINNSGEKLILPKGVEEVKMPIRLEFVQVMNYIRTRSFEYDYILFMHSDGEVLPGGVQELTNYVEQLKDDNWGVVFTHYDVFCAFNPIALKITGEWNVLLTQYFSDNEYYGRLEGLGFKKINTPGDKVIHNNNASTTMKTDINYSWIVSQRWPIEEKNYKERNLNLFRYAEFIIEKLKQTSEYSKLTNLFHDAEGNLLEITDTLTAISQILTLASLLRALNPKTILEVGTNKGLFALLVKYILPSEIVLYTHDLHSESAKVVEVLGSWVKFKQGDSADTLKELNNIDFDFAWIDGGHSEDNLYNDILQTHRLKVKVIALDDCKTMPFTTSVMNKFPEYKEVRNPHYKTDSRGIRIFRYQK